MNHELEVPRRKIKVGDRQLIKISYDDYVHSQHHIKQPLKSKPVLITNGIHDRAKKIWLKIPPKKRKYVELGILVPTSILAFSTGFAFPDADIAILGIGWHRYFLLHSALGAYVSKKFYSSYLKYRNGDYRKGSDKIIGTVLAAGAVGIGVHLLNDGSFGLLDGEKSVVFGLPGVSKTNTLIEGTLVDDNIYLLGNSLWAFKIAKDIMVMTYGKNIESSQGFIKYNFS